MKIRINPVASNCTELFLEDKTVLFSYQTPVAYFEHSTGKTFATSKKWSNTTTKHINKWTGKGHAIVNQTILDELVK
jgi:hypothetical protein